MWSRITALTNFINVIRQDKLRLPMIPLDQVTNTIRILPSVNRWRTIYQQRKAIRQYSYLVLRCLVLPVYICYQNTFGLVF